jgi:serine protease inhibitor
MSFATSIDPARRSRSPRRLAPVACLGALGVLAACGGGDPTGPAAPIDLPRPLSQAERTVIGASNSFAFDLLGRVAATEPKPNVFLSPLSASMALGMTMNGADAETWTQMRDVLGFAGLDEAAINQAYRDLLDLLVALDPRVAMAVANSVWAKEGYPFHADFMDRVGTWFDAETRELDFADPAAVATINGWVEGATSGRITELLDAIPPDAIMYLINAVYFDGDWRTTFDEDATRPAPFHLADGSSVSVDMMDGQVGYRVLQTQEGVLGVELPYGGDAFAAVAILPPQGVSARELATTLDEATWTEWMTRFDQAAESEDLEVAGTRVLFPKLEIDYDRELKDDLIALGMTDAFSDSEADFTRLTPRDSPAGQGPPFVFVSRVKQKTFLKVDERGTEAAAATLVEIVETSAGPPTLIAFDRPFLFAIRERLTGALLFIGVIEDPTA